MQYPTTVEGRTEQFVSCHGVDNVGTTDRMKTVPLRLPPLLAQACSPYRRNPNGGKSLNVSRSYPLIHRDHRSVFR
jgi:hypothetical protein